MIIHPAAAVKVDVSHQNVQVTLTAEQVMGAPSVGTHPSVSRQHRVAPYHYFGLPLVVGKLDPWNPAFAVAGVLERDPAKLRQRDRYLRSLRDLSHYGIESSEAEAGHIEDWLVDVHHWRVSYAVVKIVGGLSRKHVLVPVPRLGPVNWAAWVIYADLPRDAIINAPSYQPGRPPDADYEARLRGWYGPLRDPRTTRMEAL